MAYGFQSFAELFRGVVCHVSLALLAILISAAVIAWTARTVAAPLRRVFGGGVVRTVLAVAMVGTGIVESFSKHTNGPPRIVQLPGGGRGATALPSVTPENITNGWRVATTREGRAPSRPQDGACTIHEPWLLRGGFGDVVRIPTGGWLFPWRDGFTDGLTVFADGDIRPELRAPYFPRPFDAPLAVVPAFNWHLLPGGVSNVFWYASTPSNSLVVTWENAPVGCNANCLTNFQAEFFADGRFAYRYDDREVGYAPTFPFDWDNDGLENSVDPDPLTPAPDAHGTNAAWYNTVCANIVNSNAYYFVDVVAERGPAPIYFTGDRDSRLGNPVVVAYGGETLNDSASTTAVKVLLEAQVSENFIPNCSRHRYGVREIVLCKHFPENVSLSWHCTEGGRIIPGQGGDFSRFICPATDTRCDLSVVGDGGLSYSPVISVVEPVGFFCRTITEMDFELGANVAGGAGMALELYITPTNVCFGNIALEEVPTTTGAVGGYFENEEFSSMWAHTRERRAGQWNDIGNDNLFLMEDHATMGDVLPPMAPDGTLTNDVSFGWRDGAIIWTIPLGWNERGTSGETDPIKTNAVPEHQTFIITPDGTLSVMKAGYYVSRGTNTQIRSGRVQRC